jgi:hypothetical protein
MGLGGLGRLPRATRRIAPFGRFSKGQYIPDRYKSKERTTIEESQPLNYNVNNLCKNT